LPVSSVATAAACPDLADGQRCAATLSVLGIPVSPGSLVAYTATVSTIISAIFLIFVGAIADRSPHPTKLFATFAWTGALSATLMCLVTGTNWQMGVLLFVIANICLGSSLVIYDSLLVRIAGPNDRDRVSSKGWAFGYLGGGLLLLLNFVLVAKPDLVGLDKGGAPVSLLMAGGGGPSSSPCGLRNVTGTVAPPVAPGEVSSEAACGSCVRPSGTWRCTTPRRSCSAGLSVLQRRIQTVIGNSSLWDRGA
jgi:UMF1 family MFS transporter